MGIAFDKLDWLPYDKSVELRPGMVIHTRHEGERSTSLEPPYTMVPYVTEHMALITTYAIEHYCEGDMRSPGCDCCSERTDFDDIIRYAVVPGLADIIAHLGKQGD